MFLALLLFSHTIAHFSNGQTENATKLSKYEADEYCKFNESVLPSYSDIVKTVSVPKYLFELNDTESAWILGFPKFSPFLIWFGCFKTMYFNNARVLKERSLFRCVNHCESLKKRNYNTVGISNHVCFCFSTPYYELSPVQSAFCDIPCSNYTLDRCGGKNTMSVYSFDRKFAANWAGNEPPLKQCVFVRITNWKMYLQTSDCFTSVYSPSVNGYFCMTWWSNKIIHKCAAQAGNGKMCLIDDVTSWWHANEECMKGNGYMSYLWSSRFQTLIKNNKAYWLGRYRTFEVADESNDATSACLSVRRVENSFFIEPDSCSANKTVFCIEPSTTTASSTVIATTSGKDNATNGNNTDNKSNSKTFTKSKNYWMAVFTLPCACLVLILLFLVCIVYKKMIKTRHSQNYYLHAISSRLDDNNESDARDGHYSDLPRDCEQLHPSYEQLQISYERFHHNYDQLQPKYGPTQLNYSQFRFSELDDHSPCRP